VLICAVFCAVAWALVWYRRAAAAPIAIALGASALLDAVRELELSRRWDLALYLLHPGIGALMARAALGGLPVRARDAWVGPSLVALLAPLPTMWWTLLQTMTWSFALGSEVASVVAWRARGRETSRVALAALVLVACDAVALAELCASAQNWHLVRAVGWCSWLALLAIAITELFGRSRSAARAT
jgi:hypothetical protein